MERLKSVEGDQGKWEWMSLQKHKAGGVNGSEVKQTGSVPLAR